MKKMIKKENQLNGTNNVFASSVKNEVKTGSIDQLRFKPFIFFIRKSTEIDVWSMHVIIYGLNSELSAIEI